MLSAGSVLFDLLDEALKTRKDDESLEKLGWLRGQFIKRSTRRYLVCIQPADFEVQAVYPLFKFVLIDQWLGSGQR